MDYRNRRYYVCSWYEYPETLNGKVPSIKRSDIYGCFRHLNPNPWKLYSTKHIEDLVGFRPQELFSCKNEDADKLEYELSNNKYSSKKWIELTKGILRQ